MSFSQSSSISINKCQPIDCCTELTNLFPNQPPIYKEYEGTDIHIHLPIRESVDNCLEEAKSPKNLYLYFEFVTPWETYLDTVYKNWKFIFNSTRLLRCRKQQIELHSLKVKTSLLFDL